MGVRGRLMKEVQVSSAEGKSKMAADQWRGNKASDGSAALMERRRRRRQDKNEEGKRERTARGKAYKVRQLLQM